MAQILIIDDDGPFRDAMAQLLRMHGHQVAEAADGREGIQRQALIQADVVLCDMLMPEMGGAEAIPTLRAMTPQARIIAISGVADYGQRWSNVSVMGADQTLAKPCPYEDLIAAIENPALVPA